MVRLACPRALIAAVIISWNVNLPPTARPISVMMSATLTTLERQRASDGTYPRRSAPVRVCRDDFPNAQPRRFRKQPHLWN